jgi:hypothetical protein
MSRVGEERKEAIHPGSHKSISIDFKSVKVASETGFRRMPQADERFTRSNEKGLS